VAEEKAAKAEAATDDAGKKAPGQKPIILIALVMINMLVVMGVGFMVYKGKKKEDEKPTIDHVIQGEHKTQEEEKHKTEEIGKVIPLETFIVNLAGSQGRKVLKVNMEFEVKGNKEGDGNIIGEIDTRKAQIRDFIIIILSSKKYEEIATKEGKDALRSEIKDNINTFLSKGKITNVYFTELIYN